MGVSGMTTEQRKAMFAKIQKRKGELLEEFFKNKKVVVDPAEERDFQVRPLTDEEFKRQKIGADLLGQTNFRKDDVLIVLGEDQAIDQDDKTGKFTFPTDLQKKKDVEVS